MAEKQMSSGDGLKQRLVGAVALLVLGAIAWFWLLSGDSPVDPVDKTTQIPTGPALAPFTVPSPTAPAGVEPIGSQRDAPPVAQSDVMAHTAQAAVTAAAPASPTPAAQGARPLPAAPAATRKATSVPAAAPAVAAAPATQTFELDERGLPVAWVVQVGSFAAQANADKIKQTLQDQGYKAYSQVVKVGNGSAIKVYVGPKLSRERADAQKHAIDQILKTNTMVVRFPPA